MTAAAARKLQKDIDVVLKKVDDGIDEFAQVWEQATTSNNSAQKEKLGEELKRSINKLQRLRAQIREWIAQSDIKNNSKDKLEDARRRIENDMQRFKDFERDLKTKAFSTCALSKADELELEEVERMKYQDWLTSTIQALNDQGDELDADLELLANKKSLSSDEKARQGQLKLIQDRHRWHISKLELLLRALDNESIEMSDLAVIRDSIDVYLDNYQDPDFYHDEALYDCFDLAEFEEKTIKAGPDTARTPSMDVVKDAAGASSKEEPQKSKQKEKEKKKKEDRKDKKREEREKKVAATASPTASGSKAAAGSASGRASGTGATSPATTPKEAGTGEKKLLDDINLDEAKVQEDQLLSEAEEFICKICQIHVVGCSPKLTNCSHLFCGDCIAQWFSQHPESQTWAQRARAAGPERVVPCPVCKQPLNEKKDLYPVCGATSRSENLLLWRMLSSLKIMCENHSKLRKDGKCDWIGEYGQYQKHIASCKNLPGAENGGGAETPPAAATRKDAKSDDTPAATPTAEQRPSAAARSGPGSAPPSGPATPAQTPQAKANSQPVGQSPKAAHAPKAPPVGQGSSLGVATSASPVSAATTAAPVGGVGAPVGSGASVPIGSATTPVGAQAPAVSPKAAAPATAERVSPAGQASTPQPAKSASAAPAAAPANTAAAPEAKASEPDGSFMARATSAFEPTGPNMLRVAAGDIVQVLEAHTSGWSYCRNLTNPSSAGWAPAWIVQPASADEAAAAAAAAAAAPAAAQAAAPAAATPTAQAAQPAPKATAAPAAAAPAAAAAAPTVQEPTAVKETLRPAAATTVAAPATPTVNAGSTATQQASPVLDATSSPVAPKAPKSVVRAAASSFKAASASQLSLALNDLVEIIERHDSGWTYGRKVSHGAGEPGAPLEGWFPDWVCAQK